MAFELKINKELGSIHATLGECLLLSDIVNTTFQDGEFLIRFNAMMNHLSDCYTMLSEALATVCSLEKAESFSQQFDSLQSQYQSEFLALASKPRQYTEAAYEIYIELSAMKEIKTSYPLLKHSFGNLYEFIDKWITNDAWLVMSSDIVLKTMNRWLLDVAKHKKQDSDEAWLIYNSTAKNLMGLVQLIAVNAKTLSKNPSARVNEPTQSRVAS